MVDLSIIIKDIKYNYLQFIKIILDPFRNIRDSIYGVQMLLESSKSTTITIGLYYDSVATD